MVLPGARMTRLYHNFVPTNRFPGVLELRLRHHLTVAPPAKTMNNQKLRNELYILRQSRLKIEATSCQFPLTVSRSKFNSGSLLISDSATQLPGSKKKLLESVCKSLFETQKYPINHTSCFSSDSNDPDLNSEEQRRKTNLGAMMDLLKIFVPTLLQESLPAEMLLSNVLLRICPSHFENINAYLPNIKGHVSYYATCKALQIFLTSLVLNPRTQLHILLIRTSRFPEPNCVYAHSTKIHIRWTTCPEGCWHLSGSPKLVSLQEDADMPESSTSNAKLGSHRWSSIDPGKLLDALDLNWSLTGALANLGKGIVGLRKEDDKLERIVSGVFIFELNELNDEIIVHTVEDMEVVEHPEEQSELRVC